MDAKNLEASGSELENATKSSNELPNRKEQRIQKFGMGFLLQQIRNSGNKRKSGTNDIDSESTNKKPKIELAGTDGQQDIVYTNFPSTSSPKSELKQNIREDFELPIDAEFYATLRPVQVIAQCFQEGTTPDFGQHIRRFIGDNNYVRACKWSPSGRWLFTDSLDRIVRVFSYDDEMLSLHCKIPFGGLVYDLLWSPDLTTPHFATTSQGQPIHCWTPEGLCLTSFRGINDQDELSSAYSLSFSLNGKQLFAGYKNCIRMFELERPGRQIQDIKTFKKGTLAAQRGLVSALAMCPNFEGAFSVATYSGSLGLYSTQTNSCECLIGMDNKTAITHLQYSCDGNRLLAGLRKNPLIHCYDLRMPGRILANFVRSAATNQRLYFQLDSHDQFLYSGSSSGHLFIYDMKLEGDGDELQPKHSAKCSDATVAGLSLHPHKPLIAVCTGQRLFPNILPELFPAESEGIASPVDEKEDTNDQLQFQYTALGRGSPMVDNSLKLYNLKQTNT